MNHRMIISHQCYTAMKKVDLKLDCIYQPRTALMSLYKALSRPHIWSTSYISGHYSIRKKECKPEEVQRRAMRMIGWNRELCSQEEIKKVLATFSEQWAGIMQHGLRQASASNPAAIISPCHCYQYECDQQHKPSIIKMLSNDPMLNCFRHPKFVGWIKPLGRPDMAHGLSC